jgi:hypothetical protein
MDWLIAAAFIIGFAMILRGLLYFGERWVDRMLHFEKADPNKPIIRRDLQ